MVVCATQKTMRNLHLEPDEISAPPSAETQHWYANLIRVQQVKYYLVTESASLVTVIFPAKGLISGRRRDIFAWGTLSTTSMSAR